MLMKFSLLVWKVFVGDLQPEEVMLQRASKTQEVSLCPKGERSCSFQGKNPLKIHQFS